MPDSPVIVAVGLTKVFRDFWHRARVRAVNDLDLSVEPGEVFGLLGPNGSGKSTTIKMILGLLHPTRGRVTVFGRPPDDVRTKRRIGYLPEESYLYRFLDARETLNYYGTLFLLPRAERRRRTEELLDMVGLRTVARRPVGEYSKGMQRRIGLAQALINDPDLLILDEPTSGLDPLGSEQVKQIIETLARKGKSILLSSHLLADVEEVCQRVAILYGGRTQATGTLDDLLARRDRVQIIADRLPQQALDDLRRLIAQRTGREPDVTTPRERLEALFVRIVREAQRRQVETSGSAVPGEIAKFLESAGAEGRQVLESLLAKPTQEWTAPSTPTPATPTEDAVLRDLVRGDAGASSGDGGGAGGARPAAEPVAEPDRGVLDELTGRRDEKERARP